MQEIFSLIEQKHGPHGRDLVIRAHGFMREAHAGQLRADGTPFFSHPEAVVRILIERGHTDPVLLSAAFLHDVVEDTDVTLAEVRDEFGEEIAFLVDASTDVGKGDGRPLVADRYERMRLSHEKVLQAAEKDPRIFLIKSADRIHNLMTMRVLKPEQQVRLSREAREFHKEHLYRLGEEAMVEMIDELVGEYLDRSA